jgi:hypothetical protein
MTFSRRAEFLLQIFYLFCSSIDSALKASGARTAHYSTHSLSRSLIAGLTGLGRHSLKSSLTFWASACITSGRHASTPKYKGCALSSALTITGQRSCLLTSFCFFRRHVLELMRLVKKFREPQPQGRLKHRENGGEARRASSASSLLKALPEPSL